MSRLLTLIYGVSAYLVFFGTFLYLIGFVGDLLVPKSSAQGGESTSTSLAILIDVSLIALFALQHTIMARSWFKRWWIRFVPPQIERSTFVIATCAVFALMFWQWRPLPEAVWHVENAVAGTLLNGLSWTGWVVVLISTYLIDHFDLFGLRQTLCYAFGRTYSPPKFRENLFYNTVRHPLMLGFLVAFWATPHMTLGRFVFAATYTAYVLLALRVEERELVMIHGDAYRDYRKRVPMLLPIPKPRRDRDAAGATT